MPKTLEPIKHHTHIQAHARVSAFGAIYWRHSDIYVGPATWPWHGVVFWAAASAVAEELK